MSPECRQNTAGGPFSRLAGMVRWKAIFVALALTLPAAGALSGCGGADAELLPGETASEINANISLVEDLVAAGDCIGAENAAAAVSEQVESLDGVDQELQETLARGAARLNAVIGECVEAPDESEDDETTPSEEPDEKELERQQKEAERERERAEREAQEERREEEKAEKEASPNETPGQGKGEEEGGGPPAEPANPPSGGVAPGAPAEGAE